MSLTLKEQWVGFDLVKIGTEAPACFRCGDVVIISGCVTSVNPMRNQSNFDLSIGWIDPRCAPAQNEVSHLAPTMMSRYEAIYQCGTSAKITPDGTLSIFFNKSTNPMVLHFSGLCFPLQNQDEPTPFPIRQYEMKDWNAQGARHFKHQDENQPQERGQSLKADPERPPTFRLLGNVVFLEGDLLSATYGPVAQLIGTLPEGVRPRREVRWLATLIKEDTETERRVLDHSVALTIRPDGAVSVQGGKVHAVDNKGNMRVLQAKKRGRLSLDSVRFLVAEGEPIETAAALKAIAPEAPAPVSKSKLGYLMAGGAPVKDGLSTHTAVCFMQDGMIVLEGHIVWTSTQKPNTKQPLAQLPHGYRPLRREVFFTRGGSDTEERCRVDIDRYGRIFCPEGVGEGRLELSGIVFVAAGPECSGLRPRNEDWDELKLQYQRNDVQVVSSSFDGHVLLEQFLRRTSFYEWRYIEYDLTRHAARSMHLPFGHVRLRGDKSDPQSLGKIDSDLWREIKEACMQYFKITSFNTLLYISDRLFAQVADTIQMREEARVRLSERRVYLRKIHGAQRQSGLTYQYLEGVANDIVDQMIEHWDFRAQLQGALLNDFRPPQSIEHLFPKRWGGQERLIKKNIKEDDMAKFEEIRQFFYLYETTGNNMTHCSLMGTSDVFTTTGKWHFPDAEHVQRQLFENIAWLFPRHMYLYISERQTSRFPFIEDLDIQARVDWRDWAPGETPYPPDDLIMKKPQRDEHGKVTGSPGEMMERRAQSINMIYPQFEKLECYVYSASGYNKGKEMLKSSFHLVWPQLIVDADRAPLLRYVTLGVFANETKKKHSMLGVLQEKLIDLHESNVWELVFDSTTINARNGLRLPYSDKASMVIADAETKRKIKDGEISKTKAHKKRVQEGRPSKAIGIIEFSFDKDPDTNESRLIQAQWIADQESYTIDKWIGFGTCRRDANKFPDLTAWYMGQEVIAMLPKKTGEEFLFEQGEADGEGGHWVTHRPFPNIRMCKDVLTVPDFKKQFEDAVSEEQEALKEEQQLTLLHKIIGAWTAVTDSQAVWRTSATTLMPNGPSSDGKVPDNLWGKGKLSRPVEVVFLCKKQKIVVTGPVDGSAAILRALKSFTKPDDNAIMPIYDVVKMERA